MPFVPGKGLERPRTGLNALKAKVRVKGLSAIDQRTLPARALMDWRAELIEDLGGEASIGAVQKKLVEVTARTVLFVDHIDASLLELTTLITRRRRLVPLLLERQKMVDSLSRLCAQLGLKRVPRPPQSLAELLGKPDPEKPAAKPAAAESAPIDVTPSTEPEAPA